MTIQSNTVKKCEHVSGYYVYVRVTGKAVRYYYPNRETEYQMDMLNEKEYKTKYCPDCQERLKLNV